MYVSKSVLLSAQLALIEMLMHLIIVKKKEGILFNFDVRLASQSSKLAILKHCHGAHKDKIIGDYLPEFFPVFQFFNLREANIPEHSVISKHINEYSLCFLQIVTQ